MWRAATAVPDSDRRPTGPKQAVKAFALHQRHLETRLAGDRSPALAEWGQVLHAIAPGTRTDAFTPVLAERLAAISRAGIDAHHLLDTATTGADLPDDHAAAALWWRISRHLTPAVATSIDDRHTLTPDWSSHFTSAFGPERSAEIRDSAFWPALVTAIDNALARGHHLDTLTAMAGVLDPAVDVEPCQALVWRLSVLADPPPPPEDETGPVPPTDALAGPAPDADEEGWWPPEGESALESPAPTELDVPVARWRSRRSSKWMMSTPTSSPPPSTGRAWASSTRQTPR